jgi:hypothetical protein
MSRLTIVGGVYIEKCIQPIWHSVYGSGGRAAAATSSLAETTLVSYVSESLARDANALADQYSFALSAHPSENQICFTYLHPLAAPTIQPSLGQIQKHPNINVAGDVVLRFGMLEGDAVVNAPTVIYDPQSAFGANLFSENGSKADRLAIVLNSYEARSMVGTDDPQEVVDRLRRNENAEVVILKMGRRGAFIAWDGGTGHIPIYRSKYVWKIGSGDVFSATFAALWGVQGLDAAEAADLASRATAVYCDMRLLPIPMPIALKELDYQAVQVGEGSVYLAGPFFSLAQRWLVEETRSFLTDMGAKVFSPVHEVGPGSAEIVAPADLDGLKSCDVVFAILDGMDPGTIFEVGYAVSQGIPVVGFAENVKSEDLKMIIGSGCEIVDDYTSAIYRTLWKLAKR